MTIDDIKKIKDSVYELEGLLELAQMREDKLDELSPLIEDRIAALKSSFEADKSVEDCSGYTEEKADVVEAVAEKEELKEEVEMKPSFVEKGKEPEKPAFCLNDRFRFRRALFKNSDSEFSAAMDKLASMDSYEEAEEYFLEEFAWNPEDQDAIDFLEIIRNYFER